MTEKHGCTIPSNEEVINEIADELNAELNLNNDNEINAEKIAEHFENQGIPKNFDKPDTEIDPQQDLEDYIDEEQLKVCEENLTQEEIEKRHSEAVKLKYKGNDEFKSGLHIESIHTYTEALKLCPLTYKNDRSIFYANRAASKVSLSRKESAIDDCTKAIELNDQYVRAYLRRAKLYEDIDKLDESLADYKTVLEIDKNNKDALHAQYRLPPLIAERNEKLKTEMLGKLKDLGNMILKPFGLSTDNFQMNQDPNTGGYSVNFAQNK